MLFAQIPELSWTSGFHHQLAINPTVKMVFFQSALLISIISLISLISLLTPSLANPITPRGSSNSRCGAQFEGNSCFSAGLYDRCCSQYSYCGDTNVHCGTGCQLGYGHCNLPSLGAGNTPRATTAVEAAPTTATTFRPRLGNVPYGTDIFSCSVRGQIALTFDDGPWL